MKENNKSKFAMNPYHVKFHKNICYNNKNPISEGIISMKKLIPIGTDDFKTLIEENYYFVDKSLLIKNEQPQLYLF